jgi:hypothetical protein
MLAARENEIHRAATRTSGTASTVPRLSLRRRRGGGILAAATSQMTESGVLPGYPVALRCPAGVLTSPQGHAS